jgi:hypothetical protein
MPYALGFSNGVREARGKAAYHDDQALGQQIGHIDIRCMLKSSASHWTKSAPCGEDAEITGLLYFDIEYNDHEGVPLQSASVQIDVGSGINEEPLPIFKACAPLSAITGAPVRQHIVDTTRTDPRVAITTPSGGVEGSGYSHEVNREFDNDHRWYFKAGHCSNSIDTLVTRTRFTWMRTSEEDRAGSNRPFEGALVLHGRTSQNMILRVKVEAKPFKWRHRVHYHRSRSRNSDPIGPRAGTLLEPEAFARLQKDIQEQTLARNLDLAANGVFR